MSKSGYIPTKDPEKVIWLNNFAAKLDSYFGSFGITLPELQTVKNDAIAFSFVINLVEASVTDKKERTSYKNILRSGPINVALGPLPVSTLPPPPAPPLPPLFLVAGIFPRVGKLAERIKSYSNYTVAIGNDLGIIGAEQDFDPSALKPLLTYKTSVQGVLIIWKKNFADAIDLYVDRKDGEGWRFLARDTEPDYLDTAQLAAATQTAVWDYKGVYVINDEQVGQWSEVISVTVTKNI